MNKVAFITGAGGYIGSETALTLAKQELALRYVILTRKT